MLNVPAIYYIMLRHFKVVMQSQTSCNSSYVCKSRYISNISSFNEKGLVRCNSHFLLEIVICVILGVIEYGLHSHLGIRMCWFRQFNYLFEPAQTTSKHHIHILSTYKDHISKELPVDHVWFVQASSGKADNPMLDGQTQHLKKAEEQLSL